MTDHYTNRVIEQHVIKEIELGDGGWITVHTVESSGFGFKSDDPRASTLGEGDPFELELRGGSLVTGVRYNGHWLMRKSDEQLEVEHAKMLSKMRAERIKRLIADRANWQAREDALPDWVKCRLATFHHRGGFNFSVEGWAYELIIAELTVMYYDSEGADSPDINEYARLYGTSGNQHEVAKLLAARHRAGETLADTIGALTPLGAHPFYEQETGR